MIDTTEIHRWKDLLVNSFEFMNDLREGLIQDLTYYDPEFDDPDSFMSHVDLYIEIRDDYLERKRQLIEAYKRLKV